MELGSKALIVLAAAAVLSAEEYQAAHDHWRKSGPGTLAVTEQGIEWKEPGEPEHGRKWAWSEIQQATLATDSLRILGYGDSRWRAGRDREWEFRVPKEFRAEHARLTAALGQKYVAAHAAEPGGAVWQVGAKLHRWLGGSEGTLAFTGRELVYTSKEKDESRTWRVEDVENVSTAGRYELTVQPLERGGWTRGAREFRFQLKEPLSEAQYQALWRAVNATRMNLYSSNKETSQ